MDEPTATTKADPTPDWGPRAPVEENLEPDPGLKAMTMPGRLPDVIAAACSRYSEIYVIVSPPRCSSTAFARAFWEQPSVRYYCHEPFEVTYYLGKGLDEVAENIQSPLDLQQLKSFRNGAEQQALVIKEMPYQVGDQFPLLAAMTRHPIVFLMRDPRQNIASRMRKKTQVGDDPIYPTIESGWELWSSQIAWCRDHGVPYLLVDSSDFRGRPESIFPQVFERMALPFVPDMLRWRPCPEVDIDNLGGSHRHLYREVLGSAGIKPDESPIPHLESFPETDGWRDHVARCMTIYEEHAASPARIS